MYLGLDIGRQYVKMVAVEKTKEGYKVLDAGLDWFQMQTLLMTLRKLIVHIG